MATEPPSTLWKLWTQEQITTEMAIGYLIQNQVHQEQSQHATNLARASLRRELDDFATQLKTHQKALETLQQSVTKLHSVVDRPARTAKKRLRPDDPTADVSN